MSKLGSRQMSPSQTTDKEKRTGGWARDEPEKRKAVDARSAESHRVMVSLTPMGQNSLTLDVAEPRPQGCNSLGRMFT